MGGLTVFSDGVQALIEKGHRKITPFFIPYAITNMGSALLGIDLGLMGPNYSISTACATSNYFFYAAANHFVYFYGYGYFKRLYLEMTGSKPIGTKANLVLAAATGACTAVM
ncbi:unnamed protein product [Fraxinus pennsylvanica]|uniref:beta-ketoacyl-[acyl-carrier-protein] synthase I n=1 Tax=Fraxinus pennsylvanica TaxID=56036 RepID=A0AAD2A9R5_9LAMI|nr:unnamed protein product [Fraxinus pennsylvanica]